MAEQYYAGICLDEVPGATCLVPGAVQGAGCQVLCRVLGARCCAGCWVLCRVLGAGCCAGCWVHPALHVAQHQARGTPTRHVHQGTRTRPPQAPDTVDECDLYRPRSRVSAVMRGCSSPRDSSGCSRTGPVRRPGVLSRRRRTDRTGNRHAADADARRRRRHLAVPHDPRRSDRTPAHAGGRCPAHGGCGARLRIDTQSLAARARRDGRRHQPERQRSRTVPVDRAGRALARRDRSDEDRGVCLVHARGLAGNGPRSIDGRAPHARLQRTRCRACERLPRGGDPVCRARRCSLLFARLSPAAEASTLGEKAARRTTARGPPPVSDDHAMSCSSCRACSRWTRSAAASSSRASRRTGSTCGSA